MAIVRFNRGNLLVDDGQHARALADFDEALRLNPDFGMAYWGRAGAYAGLGDRVRALADYREARRREPEDPDVLNSLCWIFAQAGQELEEAHAACDASLAARPGDPDTLDSRGLVRLRQRRFREAWADYDAAVRAGEGMPAWRASSTAAASRRSGWVAGQPDGRTWPGRSRSAPRSRRPMPAMACGPSRARAMRGRSLTWARAAAGTGSRSRDPLGDLVQAQDAPPPSAFAA